MRWIVLSLLMIFSLGTFAGLAGAQMPPSSMRAPRIIAPDGVTAPTVVITPSAADRMVELMTAYTLSVAVGLASGSFVTSLFTTSLVNIAIGGVVGATLAIAGYGQYLSAETKHRPNRMY